VKRSTLNPRKSPKLDLRKASREELLATRLCDLPLSIRTSWVQDCITKLYSELEMKGLRFKPHVWISEDWFSPDGICGFAVPFYILHPRLIRLETELIGEAEGGDRAWCQMLMRHETGHAIDNAYHLRKNKTRQELFGLTSSPYPESYIPNARSRNYVRHLDGHYAQAHPDEDWAETFSVWLAPRSGWRAKYEGWGAIDKLLHLDHMMENIKGKRPNSQNRSRMDDISKLKITLGDYYKEKRKRLGLEKTSVFKNDLKKIFPKKGEEPAWQFVHNYKAQIIGQVAKNTRLQHYKIKRMLVEVQNTCREEELHLKGNLKDSRNKLINLMTKKSQGFLKTGPQRIIM